MRELHETQLLISFVWNSPTSQRMPDCHIRERVLPSSRRSDVYRGLKLWLRLSLCGGEDKGDKRASENNPSEKRFILVKTVLPAVTPGSLAGGCMCLFPRIYPREESSFGCSGGRGKLDVQRHRGAFRNLPHTFRSTKSARERSARNISAAVSSDCIFKTHNRRPNEHALTSYSIER